MEIDNGDVEKKTVEGNFSQEFKMDGIQLAQFLRKLADEVEAGDELRISTSQWELPFRYDSRIEVEVEKEDDELEIEIEFKEKKESDNLTVG